MRLNGTPLKSKDYLIKSVAKLRNSNVALVKEVAGINIIY